MKVKLGFERAVQLWKALRGQPLRELCSRLRDPGHRGRSAALGRERREGGGPTERCFPRQAASSMPTNSTAGAEKAGSPAFALAVVNCSSRHINFCSALKAPLFAWE